MDGEWVMKTCHYQSLSLDFVGGVVIIFQILVCCIMNIFYDFGHHSHVIFVISNY